MKAIIIYVSTYQSNTLKVAQRMANELSAFLATTREAENIDLSDYDLIGLGSGINFAQHHLNSEIATSSSSPPAAVHSLESIIKHSKGYCQIKVEILSVNFPVKVLIGLVHG